ncbi:MAG: FecR domain-containing protein [Polyangiaceae bacterium]
MSSASPCQRTWEAEAVVDGRLGEKEKASFDRHTSECAACRDAVARLRTLASLLASVPSTPRSDLDRRRQRNALLRAANAAVVDAKPRVPRIAFALTAGVALAAALAFVFGRSEAPKGASVPPPAARFEVADVAHADLHEEQVGELSRVTMRGGVASFHVEPVRAAGRFVVAVPDGEIEVRGTRFVVDVQDGKTRSVTVVEGLVEVRLGTFVGLLRAGERWPATEPAASASVAPAPAQPPASGVVVAPSAPPSVGPAVATTHASPAAPSPAASATKTEAPGARFAECMRAFDAGDYGRADALFGAFARDFPSDSRTEDALFLRATSRARRGDSAGARDAAREYLRRYPSGFRAPEAKRLVGE